MLCTWPTYLKYAMLCTTACMFVCKGFMAPNCSGTCLRIQYFQCQCAGHMTYSRLLDLKAEESRVLRHVKPPRYREASRKPRAVGRIRTQAVGTLAHGFYSLSYPSAPGSQLCTELQKCTGNSCPVTKSEHDLYDK